jgi:multicomponent Na+:H+ antiporter subunit D
VTPELLLALTVATPVAGASAALAAGRRVGLARVVGLAASTLQLGAAAGLLAAVATGGTVTLRVGGHVGPASITLVADLFAALLLAVATLVLAVVHLFAVLEDRADRAFGAFHAVYLVLGLGVALAFTTGDLFTLFVAFEVTLIASYVLLTSGGRPDQVRAGMIYTVVNVTAGLLLLTAVAAIHGATGTLDLATLAQRFPQLDDGVRLLLGGLLVVPFAAKAALFPLSSWLPDAYPVAPTPITAVFAALLTKLGVYALARTLSLLGLPELGPPLVVVASITMLVGVLGALAQRDVKRILSFHAVSQVGYLLFAVALLDVAGLAAAILFLVHYILVKTALFLVVATLEARHGGADLERLGGIARSAPGLAALFAIGALTLTGLPPTAGFVAKLAVVQAGLGAAAWLGTAAALVAGLGTLLSMLKVWQGAFWGEPREAVADRAPRRRDLTLVPTAGLIAASVVVAVAAGPLVDLTARAGADLADPARYVAEVLP